MNSQLIKATVQAIIDGQSYLYSLIMSWKAELYGQALTEEQMEELQDEWKKNTSELIVDQLTGREPDDDE